MPVPTCSHPAVQPRQRRCRGSAPAQACIAEAPFRAAPGLRPLRSLRAPVLSSEASGASGASPVSTCLLALLLSAGLCAPAHAFEDKDPVPPFTLYGNVSKTFIIETLRGEDVVSRQRGVTVRACATAVPESADRPGGRGAAAAIPATCSTGVKPGRFEKMEAREASQSVPVVLLTLLPSGNPPRLPARLPRRLRGRSGGTRRPGQGCDGLPSGRGGPQAPGQGVHAAVRHRVHQAGADVRLGQPLASMRGQKSGMQ